MPTILLDTNLTLISRYSITLGRTSYEDVFAIGILEYEIAYHFQQYEKHLRVTPPVAAEIFYTYSDLFHRFWWGFVVISSEAW